MVTGEAGHGGGIGGFGVAEEEEKPLGGTGGAAGGGTRAGEGRPSGEEIGLDHTEDEAALETAALGDSDDHDETPALEYGEGDRPHAPTIGEALGTGAGTHVGSGTRANDPAIGGGVPLEEEGNESPGGTRSPGQDT
ncbi:MAG TPA: hypothetical protein VFW39_12880 [Sphingomicrobium sp.]|nr:hypothetical protein [Sphingomicrobium sp.]